jgi:hypothetical protein
MQDRTLLHGLQIIWLDEIQQVHQDLQHREND